MKRFKSIVVGVDLSWGDRFVADELSAPNAEAVRQALWLAKLNSASVEFFFSLDVSERARRLLADGSAEESSVLSDAENRLSQLVRQAGAEGIAAGSQVVVGKSWVELIRQVIRKQHDLVLVGTRHMSVMHRFFVGSTGIKLLRKCPCAVWVTQPRTEQVLHSILVAHDLRPVGDLAMQLGCSMATLQHAQLHVLHAAEYPEFDYMFPARISAEKKREYDRAAEDQISKQLAGTHLPMPAKVHFAVAPPDAAIMDCVEQLRIGLVVMGTVGRAGVRGFITGNTAERLLAQLPCSLLAVKPPGFQSPVELGDDG